MKLTRSYRLAIYPNFHKLEDIRYSANRYQLYEKNFISQLYFNQHIPYYSTKGMGTLANIAQREARGQVKALHALRSKGIKTNPPELNIQTVPGTIVKSNLSSFNYWINIVSQWGNTVKVPVLSYKKLNQKLRTGWTLSKECKVQKFNNKWYAIVYVTKKIDIPVKQTNFIGVDVGVNHGVSRSDNYQSANLRPVIKEETDKQKQRSRNHHKKKPFKTKLKQLLDIEVTRILGRSKYLMASVVVENPKTLANLNMKKLNRWAKSYFANRLQTRALEENVWVSFVNPAYSSQRCFNCNKIDRQSRVGQKFHCVGCGHQANADINAAKNLAWMGREKIYSLRSAKVPLKELNF